MRYLLIYIMFTFGAITSNADYVDTLEDSARMSSHEGVLHIKKMLATGKYADHLNAALCRAAQYSTLEMVKTLVDAGADVNTTSGGKTPLCHVANRKIDKNRSNGLDIAKYLVNRGADVDGNASEGDATPMYVAAERNPEVALWLLEHGATPNVTVTFLGHTNNVLGKAVEFPTGDKYRTEFVRKLLNMKVDVNICGEQGPPLHNAARCGNLKLAQLLVKAGAGVNTKHYKGTTPLHWTMYGHMLIPCERKHSAIADLLLRSGADPTLKDDRGRTPHDIFNKYSKRWKSDAENAPDYEKERNKAMYDSLELWLKNMPKILKRVEKGYYQKYMVRETTGVASAQKEQVDAKTTHKKNNFVVASNKSENKSKPSVKVWFLLIGSLCAVVGVSIFIVKKASPKHLDR